MKREKLQIYDNQPIRTAWDEENEEWYFSIVDVVGVLTDQPDVDGARNYWKVLKNRLAKEGSQLVTNCNQLKMLAQDGKKRLTDVANTEQLLRLAPHSIHSLQKGRALQALAGPGGTGAH